MLVIRKHDIKFLGGAYTPQEHIIDYLETIKDFNNKKLMKELEKNEKEFEGIIYNMGLYGDMDNIIYTINTYRYIIFTINNMLFERGKQK